MKALKITLYNLLAISAAIQTASAQNQPPAAPATAAAASPSGAPKIQFEAQTYDFGKITSGSVVKHEFIFTNAGNALLEITAVRPGCGCTTAGEWSKQVEPGKTGTITLQFNSTGFGGLVAKTATVTCNDPAQGNLTLQLSGNVWKEVDVQPTFAVMNANPESVGDAKSTVKIINNAETKLDLLGMEINNSMFVADLKTNQPGKEYELTVRVQPPLNANMNHGVITLKTSNTNVPQVQVTAMLMLQPIISVSPPQLNLPPPPLANSLVNVLTVHNAGTNSIKLTDLASTDKRIGVSLKETEPGKSFNIEVNIPQGYETQNGQPIEITAKTSHPSQPEIKIPILQLPRPTAALPVTPPAPADAHAH